MDYLLYIDRINDNGTDSQTVHVLNDCTDIESVLAEHEGMLVNEPLLDWTMTVKYGDRVVLTRCQDELANDDCYYLLTYDGYAFNSQSRDNMDVITKRAYDAQRGVK
jgi:hypothetical protein